MPSIACRFALFVACALVAGDAVAAPAGEGPLPTGRVTIEGAAIGSVASVETPRIHAAVVSESGGSTYVKKRLGAVRYADAAFVLGPGASKWMHEWIAAAWEMDEQRKNVELEAGREKYQMSNTVIAETTLPACDARRKDKAGVMVRLSADHVRTVASSGGSTSAPSLFSSDACKLTIDGAVVRVVRIEPLRIQRPASAKTAGKINFPNLVVHVAPDSAKFFMDWHQDFVVKGNNAASNERNALLEYLGSDGKAQLRIEMHNVGTFSLQQVTLGGELMVRVEMYVERMRYEAVGAGQPANKLTVEPRKPAPTVGGKPITAPTPRVPIGTKKSTQ